MHDILIIDDCEFTQELLTNGLGANGYSTIHTASGGEGLSIARAEHPDIIILALGIEDADGIDVVRAMRSEPLLDKSRIIALDANGDLKLDAFAAGCDDVVLKPFSFDELNARVHSFLRRSRRSRVEEEEVTPGAKWIAVHSMRGGVGCSSIAANTATILNRLWGTPTLLVDAAPWGGLLGQYVGRRSERSWAMLDDLDYDKIDRTTAAAVVDRDPSGLDLILSPPQPVTDPKKALLKLRLVLELLAESYEYIVVDGISALDQHSIEFLTRADRALLVATPDIYSLVNASASLRVLVDSGIERDKLEVTISHASWNYGMSTTVVEQAFDKPVRSWIRYAPTEFQKATNSGEVVVNGKKYSDVVRDLEDVALMLSKPEHLLIPPAEPSAVWVRAKKRWGTFPNPKSERVQQEVKSSWSWPFS